jgi:hypothetical protein
MNHHHPCPIVGQPPLAPEGLTGRVVNRDGVHPSDLQSPFSTVPATTWPEELVSR